MPYNDVKFKTPDVFKDMFLEKKSLIISGGESTKNILEYKKDIREIFDVIIVVNYAFKYFDDIADFHIVAEKFGKFNMTPHVLADGNKYRTDIPRIVNWKGIEKYSNKYNLYKTSRCNFDGKPNVREYKHKGKEGLLVGPVGTQGFALGTATLSAMHFAAILGVNEIYMVGADLIFKGESDHFYGDNYYREKQHLLKKSNRHIIVDVKHDGKIYKTAKYFKESAECINHMIKNVFNTSGIDVFDFSDGLVTEAKKLNINEFVRKSS